MGPIDPGAAAAESRADHMPIGFIVGVAACSLAALGALAAVATRGAVPAGIGLTLARRLGRLLKPQDTLARLAGDQFGLILL